MHPSKIVLLINDDARCLSCVYDPDDKNENPTLFKTLDPTIKVDDYVIVETGTRHNMTVAKVHETDLDVDFDSTAKIRWIVGKVDTKGFERLLEQEKEAIAAVNEADRKRKKDELKKAMFANHEEKLKMLQIANSSEADQLTETPPSPPDPQ